MTFFGVTSSNLLVLQKSSTESYFTWKYFCPYSVDVNVKRIDEHYSTCIYRIKYDPTKETLSLKTLWSWNFANTWFFDSSTTFYWNHDHWGTVTSDKLVDTFKLTLNSTWVNSTELKFVDKFWNNPTVFDTDHDIEVVRNGNTLTWVVNLIIPYEACPCNMDKDAPKVTEASHKFTSEKVLSWRYVWEQIMKFLVYDYSWSAWWSYWYSGFSNTDLTKYQGVPSTLFVDNQEWVNSGTIKVKIEYLDPAYWSMSGKSDEFGTGGAWFYSIHEYTWTLKNWNNKYISEKTWDSNYRWYWIEVKNTTWFLVEKKVKVTIEATDNELDRDGDVVCERKGNNLKSMIWSWYINQPTDPEIEWIYPEDSSSSINPNLTVSMKLSDDWAGIDTGSLVVWATYPVWVAWDTEEDTGEWISITKEYSWDFFTWWMFELTGNGQPGLWNSWSYVVTFTLTGLTESTWIILSWYVEDLADNFTGSQISFETRMPCSAYGCRDNFFIRQWNGEDWINNPFKWFVIFVTWSDMIELIWENNEVLMCGWDLVPAYLTWNIKMFDNEWNEIQSDYEITRLNDIYITWLDVLYYEDTKTLSIND